ncbi:hypothetical protein JQT66_00695 [Sulfitobacter mediterraneus]|uniref:calcium-binding protein n=1 Tax=Sulfitobacter mediterraneus TaxID=83219 RepID=UPI001931C09F|nr:calcium-binding protein [Sulfitobacter mediterraneus]MBM1308675.1 hypothetical protein [Sulfitobacter mediterraneus]MBM1312560.1 hypothetical protein [Sulfitobacter mediterraneus]MBM1320941.1 hypothetical protein [Sulfitobacter mediterraneus]MBM1324829.1 hypothetical protein [Sulfitobacter mediterraneus]MBM1396175.1 hypothetical protein [Sulfitobacter mediterraneus]
MVRADFSVHAPLFGTEENALVGINDLLVVPDANGGTLYTATRGDGWLTAFDIGGGVGQTELEGHWRISPQYLQLETTDLVLKGADQLFMAGLNSADLQGVSLDAGRSGTPFTSAISVTTQNTNARFFTEVALEETGQSGIAALRGGGVVQVSFGSGGQLTVSELDAGGALDNARAADVLTASHNGETYSFASYGTEDSVSMFKKTAGGSFEHLTTIGTEHGLWVDRPGAMAMTTAVDGGMYLVTAASGSGSLSVMSITAGGMIPVDHILDSAQTRFADASHVTSISMGAQDFVLAAGSDAGISFFAMLPGGRLQHVTSMEASADAPLNGITALEAMATPDGIRIWASTETAPFLSEFSVDLHTLGISAISGNGGGALTGSDSDDILSGGAGADHINGGSGDDLISDGAGEDTLRGGGGADTFVLTADDAQDRIVDYQATADRIDISAFSQINGVGAAVITSRSYGADLRIGDDITEIHSATGISLDADDFDFGNLITGNRVETDPGRYPEATNPPRLDPVPDPEPVEDPQPINSTIWQEAPEFNLQREGADQTGTERGEAMYRFGSDDRLLGGGGNDTIQSGAGNDSVGGDAGNDEIHGGGDHDFLVGAGGFDTINGGDGDDTICGDSHADSLNGGDGQDVILGGDGFDQINAGSGADRVWAGAAPDRVYGGDGDDWLSAGSNYGTSVDGLWGEGGNDTLFGNAGFDYLIGGDGDDLIDGGHQADNLYGEDGNDTLIGDQGFDRLFGGDGNDVLSGGEMGDALFGEEGNDTLDGGEGDDRFFGGTGDDRLLGGTGVDTLQGGAGFDTIEGGAGDDLLFGNFNADHFVFADGHGHDRVADFETQNDQEVLDLSGLSSLNSFADVMNLARQSGWDVVIDTSPNSSIRLIKTDLQDLSEDDIVF